jgi:hypothetical protein
MEIKTINITIDPDELELIGSALEDSIKREVEALKRESFDLLCDEHRDLLRAFVNCGYSIWLDAGEQLAMGRLCHDVDEFVDHLYREKEAEVD